MRTFDSLPSGSVPLALADRWRRRTILGLTIAVLLSFTFHGHALATTCAAKGAACSVDTDCCSGACASSVCIATPVRPEDCPVGVAGCPCNGFDNTDDTACWQWALDKAKSTSIGGLPIFGTVEATPTAKYYIFNTLTVNSTFDGVINGNGAELVWLPPSPNPNVPMFLLEDTQWLKISNLVVISDAGHHLKTAFEFTNGPGSIQPGMNILDHVRISGTNAGGLDYGVRFSIDRYPNSDAGNDQSTIINSAIDAVMKAAISIEGTQSHNHRFISVNASAAEGNENTCVAEPLDPIGDGGSNLVCGASFVRNALGDFTSIGGYRNNFKNAEFYMLAPSSPSTIISSDSEGCGRFIRTPSGNACFDVPVTVIGGRFATDHMKPDGQFIAFHRHGPLSIRGLRVDGYWTASGISNPTIVFDPPISCDPVESDMEVVGVEFQIKLPNGSDSYDPISLGGSGRVTSWGNTCLTGSGGPAPCLGKAAGSVTFGLKASKAGLINISNNQSISARNVLNLGDINVAKLNSVDKVELGDAQHPVLLPSTATGGGLQVGANGTAIWQILCGSISVSAGSLAKGHATLSPTVTNLPAGAACTCSPQGAFVASNNQTLAYENCYSTAGVLSLRFLNTSNGSISTNATTVDYCCSAK